jgi:drug/metabolite transporter (DMT)-like permease
MGGFPLSMLMLGGLSLAPAAHGATIAPGTVTVIGAVGSWLMFREPLGRSRIAGLGVVLVGLACIGWAGTRAGDPAIWRGDLLFFATGLIWGGYPLLLQRWRLDALGTTAVVSVLSLAYLPIYGWWLAPAERQADWGTIALHAFNQGVLNSVVGLWLWAKGVTLLGAGPAGRFPPLIPVVGTLTAIPLLGEWPGPAQTIGVALIVGGLVWVARAGR